MIGVAIEARESLICYVQLFRLSHCRTFKKRTVLERLPGSPPSTGSL